MIVDITSLVILDTGVLGAVSNPAASPAHDACKVWMRTLLSRGIAIAIPEIADYEIRRELRRGDKLRGVKSLDFLKSQLRYIPIDTEMMLRAADLWALMRKSGTPTAADKELDGDMILAAQSLIYAERHGNDLVIATNNAKHLDRVARALPWTEILT